MKIAIRTIVFHFMCILVFSLFYFYFKDDFEDVLKKETTFSDCFFLSTTIQAGVGMTDVYPITLYGKIIMIAQQIIMIMTHVFTIYVFR
jgi:hypothetical protein